MFCDQCGQSVPPSSAACPHCRATLEPLPAQPPTPVVVPAPPTNRHGLLARYPQAGYVPQGAGSRAYISGITRNLWGTLAGIVGAWFNMPFVVLAAGIGALFGGLAGVVSGTFAGVGVLSRIDALITWVFPLPVKAKDLLPTAGAQIGGIVGGILGALHGGWELAWMAAAWPWEQLYAEDPTWPIAVALGQIVTALVVALLYVWWSTVAEATRLRVSGARRLSRREAEWLMPIVFEAAERLELTALPRFLVDDRREPNAHAGIRHVVINYGLIDQLDHDRDQVGAIVTHELVHWRDGDAIAMAWARGIALPLFLLYDLASKLLDLARSRPLHFLVRFLFWSVIVTVRRFVLPVQAGLWRRLEYRADALAAAAGYRSGLRGALTYLRRSFDGQRSGWDEAILATHPPNELRLERLEEPERRYPLDEDHPLTRALPGWTHSGTVEKGW